ncbi:hypothetical protein [Allohahella marinimesophila]|uniref:Sel1 repeat-containing protein n=1 Tax=Allohahella marinimesophila TaxID=1054972 RepID=A0ABP7NTR2_9GAMM
MRRLILTLIASAALSGCVNQAQVQQGQQAFLSGDYATAADNLNGPAQNGDMVAQYTLGKMWHHGLGNTPKNPDEAANWYRMSANQGYIPAMRDLGILFIENGYHDFAVDQFTIGARYNDDFSIQQLRKLGAPVPDTDLYRQKLANEANLQRQRAVAEQQYLDAAGEIGAAIGASAGK